MKQLLLIICLIWGVAFASYSSVGGQFPRASNLPLIPAANTDKPFPGRFLVASRSLSDPRFTQSVVYLVKHGSRGTLGLIINRPGNVSLLEAIPGIEDKQAGLHTLYYGGPVGQTVVFMLMRNEPDGRGMARIIGGVSFSSERRVLDRMLGDNKLPNEIRFHIGHSGWAPGQLLFEIQHGSWHVVDGDVDTIFSDKADSLWGRFIEDLEPLGIQANH